jgi:hypothetical protein
MDVVNALVLAGHAAHRWRQASRRCARYTVKPGVIVVLTDGEETCGGSPCEIGALHALAKRSPCVIAYRPGSFPDGRRVSAKNVSLKPAASISPPRPRMIWWWR